MGKFNILIWTHHFNILYNFELIFYIKKFKLQYSLRPKKNDVLEFKICPKKNDALLNLACVHVHVAMQQSISSLYDK
jgi:hypothetical protein